MSDDQERARRLATDGPLTGADTPESVEILASETPFQGYFRVDRYTLRHRKHDGSWSDAMTREVFERGHAVAVLPYDPVRDEVVLIEQFRPGALAGGMPPWQIEVVAGIIEPGEPAGDVARREAEEESGLQIRELIPITRYLATPGGSSETIRLYCGLIDATNAGGLHGLDAENEDIQARAMAYDDAFALLGQGPADNAPTIIGLYWLALNRAHLRARAEADTDPAAR
jgi:ADP-ribose pyrophosphatase